MKNILTHHKSRIELDLTLNQAAILDQIHRDSGYYLTDKFFTGTYTELGDALGLTRQTVKNCIDDLVKSGHLKEYVNKETGRNKYRPSEKYIRFIR